MNSPINKLQQLMITPLLKNVANLLHRCIPR